MSLSSSVNPILSTIPGPADRRIALRIRPQAERSLLHGHPWLFNRSIAHQSFEGKAGDLAVIFGRNQKFLAVGLYDPHSTIRVRILNIKKPAEINRDWFKDKLGAAIRLRDPLFEQPEETMTTGFRLAHGENDNLPGLVIDRYDKTLVIKLYTLAWVPHLVDVLAALDSVIPGDRQVIRLGRAVTSRPEELYGLSDGTILAGPAIDGPVTFQENGLTFEVDVIQGQKTGFFFDQRDNRARVERLAGNKDVLNLFAYTGGFSVYAARGGAKSIVSIDSSKPAMEAAEKNMALNRAITPVAQARHETQVEDAFAALARMASEGRRFDMVIVDPPAFARNKEQEPQAISAYQQLTRMSLAVLRPGGTLVQASCSSQVEADTFFRCVHSAAVQTGRPLQEIERTGHALDHPITFREGAYLKCLFAVAQ